MNMFGTQHLALFVVSGLLLAVTPGQDTLYIVGRSVSQGRRAGLLSVLGIVTGCANPCGCRGVRAVRGPRHIHARIRRREDGGRGVSLLPRSADAPGARRSRRACEAVRAREQLGDFSRRAPDERAESQGGAVFHGVPAAIRLARRPTRASSRCCFSARSSFSTARSGA